VAQSTFYRTYGTDTLGEGGNAVVQTADGGYLIAGWEVVPAPIQLWKGNGVLLRTNPQGEIEWRQAIVAPGTHSIEFRDLIINAEGQYVATGVYSHEWNASPMNHDVQLGIFDSGGVNIWTVHAGGPFKDWGEKVLQTLDGGYIVCGSRQTIASGLFGHAAFLMRFSSVGDSLWLRTLAAPNGVNQYSYCIAPATDDGFFLGGGRHLWGESRPLVIRTDEFGDTLWTRRLDSLLQGEVRSIIAAADGGVLAAGWCTATGLSRPFLAKLDSAGDLLWSNTYSGVYPGWAYSIRETAAGYTLAGLTGQYHYMMHGVDFDGQLLWSHTIEPEGYYGYGYSIALTTDGGYAMTGVEVTAASEDIVLIKTNSVGQLNTAVQEQGNSVSLGITAFPNPAERQLTVTYEMKRAEPVTIRIMDLHGRELRSSGPHAAGKGSATIDLDGLAQGPFLIGAYSPTESWVIRVITR